MPPSSDFNGEEVLAFTIDLARRAGKLIVQGLDRRNENSGEWGDMIKKNSADLVTEVDQNTEAFVKREIAARYPQYKFIGEESWAAGEEHVLTDEGCFIVDPVDGTTNAVHGFPFFCISIGFCWKSKPVIGVVYAPLLDTLFSALSGHGAHMTSPVFSTPRKLPLPGLMPLPSLKQAVAALEWGSDRRAETVARKSNSFAKLCGDEEEGVKGGQMLQGVRSIGSAALSCCYVAQGALDMWHEYGCWAWDVCAGIVIVQEAGGIVVGGKSEALASVDSDSFGEVTPALLQGRKYLVVRPVPDSESGKGRDAQKRAIQGFYETIDEWDLA